MTNEKPLKLRDRFIYGEASLERAHILASRRPSDGEPEVLTKNTVDSNIFPIFHS